MGLEQNLYSSQNRPVQRQIHVESPHVTNTERSTVQTAWSRAAVRDSLLARSHKLVDAAARCIPAPKNRYLLPRAAKPAIWSRSKKDGRVRLSDVAQPKQRDGSRGVAEFAVRCAPFVICHAYPHAAIPVCQPGLRRDSPGRLTPLACVRGFGAACATPSAGANTQPDTFGWFNGPTAAITAELPPHRPTQVDLDSFLPFN